MLVNEQHIVLETRVEMRFETQLDDDGIVMAVDMRIDTVEALEHVADERREGLGKRYADAAWEHLLVVHVGLYPGHEVFDVFGRGHLGGSLVLLAILPKVLKPDRLSGGAQKDWVDLLVCGFHLRTALRRAELGDGPI